MTTALEFSIGTKSTYICDLYLIAKETEIDCVILTQLLSFEFPGAFGGLLLFVIYNAFVELAKQSRSLLITESFHFSWITEVFATL